MVHVSPDEIKKHTKTYLLVFGALFVLTIVTVSASRIEFGVVVGIGVALAIASVKGSLVAAYFMHLAHAEKIIYWVLLLCVIFFAALLLLPILVHSDSVGVQLVPLVTAVEHGVAANSVGEHIVP